MDNNKKNNDNNNKNQENNTASTPKLTAINSLGEFGLIDHLTRHFKHHKQPSTIKGVGDDAAVMQPIASSDELCLLATDLLIEGIHFDLHYTALKHLGYKAVAVNLSDIYAMNGTPTQIVVSLAVSSRMSVEALDELYDGIYAACRDYEVDLVGGDTSSSVKGMFINIAVFGQVNTSKITYRSGAKSGDLLCVTGFLGAAYLGLQILEREKQIYIENPNIQPYLAPYQYCIGRLLRPEPRRDIVEILNNMQIVPTSMIDVSDGLSSEVLHLCKNSQVGCHIYDENIPLHPEMFETARELNLDPLTCVFNGGEDYELLFTVNPSHLTRLDDLQGIAIIGKITEPQHGAK